MPTNKVRFNLKNVHYAPVTFSAGGVPSFGTPVPIPGAVSLKVTPQGEAEKFYADGGVYYVVNNNSGYNGEISLALLPEGFRIYALSETLDTNNVLQERSDVELKPFALLFEFDGDQRHIRHVLYNCTASRPTTEGKTNEEKKDVQTETLNFNAAPLPNGIVKGATGDSTDTDVYNGWFSAVYYSDTTVNVARLATLTIANATLTPSFSDFQTSYNAVTTSASGALSATGANGASVQILVNGSAHTSGNNASWSVGNNLVVIIVTKSGYVGKTYTINVVRKSS